MKTFLFSLSIWRWNPAVAIRRVRGRSAYDNFDFKTAMKVAHTLVR